jgi:hypothetical protein
MPASTIIQQTLLQCSPSFGFKCIANHHVDITIGLGMFANSGFGTSVIELYQYITREIDGFCQQLALMMKEAT